MSMFNQVVQAKPYFKILNTKIGLFSCGGTKENLKWSHAGKTWTSYNSLKGHLALHKLASITDWMVVRYIGSRATYVPATSVYGKGVKFEVILSPLLAALLNYSRQSSPDFSWIAIRDNVLGDIYHPDMTSADVLQVVTTAFEEAIDIPELECSQRQCSREIMMKVPFVEFYHIYNRSSGEEFTPTFVLNSYIAHMMNQLRFAKNHGVKIS